MTDELVLVNHKGMTARQGYPPRQRCWRQRCSFRQSPRLNIELAQRNHTRKPFRYRYKRCDGLNNAYAQGPFQCLLHSHCTMAQAQFSFSNFFQTGSKVSTCQVSSLSDQPFRFFHKQIQNIHPIFDCFYKEKHLAQTLGYFASSKKGSNIIGSKMGAQ